MLQKIIPLANGPYTTRFTEKYICKFYAMLTNDNDKNGGVEYSLRFGYEWVDFQPKKT